jgi:hypothetical protein
MRISFEVTKHSKLKANHHRLKHTIGCAYFSVFPAKAAFKYKNRNFKSKKQPEHSAVLKLTSK